MSKRISEPVSENTPKRPRGRPRKFTAADVAGIRTYYPDVRTQRGLQNKLYQQRAIGLLMDKPEFHKLIPPYADVMAGTARFWSFNLLTELGRIDDDDFLLAVATLICGTPGMSKRHAIATARHNRLRTD